MVNVYPDTIIDTVNIATSNESETGSYIILSSLGTIVSHGIITNGEANINTETLNRGSYIVHIKIGAYHTSYNITKK